MNETEKNLRQFQRKNFFLKEKNDDSFWLQQLPAHFWIQGEDNIITYSNHLPKLRLSYTKNHSFCGEKTRCCKYFKDRDTTCSCCPRERISTTLKPEKCLCRKGNTENLVYHFPYVNDHSNKGSMSIMKIEMNVPTEMFFDNSTNKNQVPEVNNQKKDNSQDPFIRICSSCKSIRKKNGGWVRLENFFSNLFNLKFTHGICPECACKLYPNLKLNKDKLS